MNGPPFQSPWLGVPLLPFHFWSTSKLIVRLLSVFDWNKLLWTHNLCSAAQFVVVLTRYCPLVVLKIVHRKATHLDWTFTYQRIFSRNLSRTSWKVIKTSHHFQWFLSGIRMVMRTSNNVKVECDQTDVGFVFRRHLSRPTTDSSHPEYIRLCNVKKGFMFIQTLCFDSDSSYFWAHTALVVLSFIHAHLKVHWRFRSLLQKSLAQMLFLWWRWIYLCGFNETAFDLPVGTSERDSGEDFTRAKRWNTVRCSLASTTSNHCVHIEFRNQGASFNLGTNSSGKRKFFPLLQHNCCSFFWYLI